MRDFLLFLNCFCSSRIQGASCPYRHEAAALGHEQICVDWKMGQCFEVTCPNRHMVIEKERNQIQCYWENKPNGCTKPHCVFKHTKPQNIAENNDDSVLPPSPMAIDNSNINLVAPAVAATSVASGNIDKTK